METLMRRLRQLKRTLFGGERELKGAQMEIRMRVRDFDQRFALYDRAEELWFAGMEAEEFRSAVRKLIEEAAASRGGGA